MQLEVHSEVDLKLEMEVEVAFREFPFLFRCKSQTNENNAMRISLRSEKFMQNENADSRFFSQRNKIIKIGTICPQYCI